MFGERRRVSESVYMGKARARDSPPHSNKGNAPEKSYENDNDHDNSKDEKDDDVVTI